MMMTVPSNPEPTAMRSALIVDDHPLFCDALSMTLKTFVGIAEIQTEKPAGCGDGPARERGGA